jgi:flagellar assembly protein FliH
MSCRLLPSDGTDSGAPLVWRQAAAAAPAKPKIVPKQPEPKVQDERLWEQRVREARAAGIQEGEAAARNRAAAELDAAIQKMARSVEQIAGMKARLRREAESDVVELAVAIARRILRRQLVVDPDALHGLVLAALEKLQGQEIARVRVHSSHTALVTTRLKEFSCSRTVEVVSDTACEPGTVVFETERGNLDASVESQLAEIQKGLADRLKR